jgi:acyl-ACP thioesterase
MNKDNHTIAEYMVSVQETDPFNRIHLYRLMDYAQDCDGIDSARLNMNSVNLRKQNVVWILLSLAYRFDGRFPAADEKLIVDTWTRGTRGIRFFRDNRYYRNVMDEEHCFGAASSEWILASLDDHMPIRPSHVCDTDEYNKMSDQTVGYLDKVPNLKPLPEDAEVRKMLRYTVHFGDLDLNNHFHNTHYARLAIDAAVRYLTMDPSSTELAIRAFHITFIKEVLYGEELVVCVSPDPSNESVLRIEGRVEKPGMLGEPSFRADLTYSLISRSMCCCEG